jgi:tetrapyrrole methylase family protein/MazG family protein
VLSDAQGVLANWERLKQAERESAGKEQAGLMEGVPVALPALSQAESYQKRAARVGFDWPNIQGVYEKIDEELAEIHQASGQEERVGEVGDLLFAAVNLARWLEVDAESALREANMRFRKRFEQIESSALEKGQSVSDLSLDEMEALWQKAKGRE